jgi:hypothetical protein
MAEKRCAMSCVYCPWIEGIHFTGMFDPFARLKLTHLWPGTLKFQPAPFSIFQLVVAGEFLCRDDRNREFSYRTISAGLFYATQEIDDLRWLRQIVRHRNLCGYLTLIICLIAY